MENHPKRQTPQGWPKDIPLPSEEDAERLVREGEEKLRKEVDELRKKCPLPKHHPHEYVGF